MIEALGIVKRYGRIVAVDRVSFHVPHGSVCGFLGPNGAGKSTTIRMVVGAVAPDEGMVRVAGMEMGADAREARRAVGYLPEESPLQPDLTVDELVRLRADLWGVPRRVRAAAVDRALERCDVVGVRRRLCGQLSKGYRQRVGLAAAIVHSPRVVVLDEPTSGLDPAQVREFRSLLQALREDASVLLSSHVLAEVEASCDRAVLIDRGQTVAQGTLDELRALGAASEAVELECDRDASAALGALGAVERATSTALAGGWWRVGLELRRGADASEACGAAGRALRDAGIAVRRIERAPVELESVFHRILAAGARR